MAIYVIDKLSQKKYMSMRLGVRDAALFTALPRSQRREGVRVGLVVNDGKEYTSVSLASVQAQERPQSLVS